MLFQKKGMPQEGDCVFCTVTKVQYHSVFAKLDEYENKSGMIHISEISPGRIRNINEYVKEGKVVICKILRINKERGHIDLSLRRVNESQRRAKVEERKQQIIAENILQSYAQLKKLDVKKVYKDVSTILLKSFPTLYAAFEDVVENENNLVDVGLDKDLAADLDVIIKERIKPKQVSIIATLSLESYDSDGVDIINGIMKQVVEVSDHLKVQFLGSGSFKCEIITPDYAQAEEIYKEMETVVSGGIKGHQTEYTLART
ncbi:MAG: S1 RNA-binding domain-containing protein [Nanoarchaeota archaeon]|nr:S1 RNA-binding domain-containing protein [Nanoarchaeota archaeon]